MSRCGERGQSLVELAFVVPLLLLLLVGIIEIGRFAYYSILVANAARAGAISMGRKAWRPPRTLRESLRRAPTMLTGITAPNTLMVTFDANSADAQPQTLGPCGALAVCVKPEHPLVYVQVTAIGSFESLFNYPGLPGTFNVTSVQEMRVAQ